MKPKILFFVREDFYFCSHRLTLARSAKALQDEKRLREEGFFDPVPTLKMWQEHVNR